MHNTAPPYGVHPSATATPGNRMSPPRRRRRHRRERWQEKRRPNGCTRSASDELRQALLPPVRPMVNRRQTEALIRQASTIGPAACTEPDATT